METDVSALVIRCRDRRLVSDPLAVDGWRLAVGGWRETDRRAPPATGNTQPPTQSGAVGGPIDLPQQDERGLVVLLVGAGLRVGHLDGELDVAEAAVEEVDAVGERAGVAEADHPLARADVVVEEEHGRLGRRPDGDGAG